jgi:hypothetical protein
MKDRNRAGTAGINDSADGFRDRSNYKMPIRDYNYETFLFSFEVEIDVFVLIDPVLTSSLLYVRYWEV